MAAWTSGRKFRRPSIPSPRNVPSRFEGEVDAGSYSYQVSVEILGSGSFGLVLAGTQVGSATPVAIKCGYAEGEGEAMRAEYEMLKKARGRYVVEIWDCQTVKATLDGERLMILVFEKASCSLQHHLADHTIPASSARYFAWQLSSGLRHLHTKRIVHRDLAPKNVLLFGEDGGADVLKIADLGSARCIGVGSSIRHKYEVVTLPYRAPELLLGSPTYGQAIDCWSYGCIVAELAIGRPIFRTKETPSEVGTMMAMFALLGAPNDRTWPDYHTIPTFVKRLGWRQNKLGEYPTRSGCSMFQHLGASGCKLLRGCLELEPAKRLTASDAESHEYFQVPGVSINHFPFNQFDFEGRASGSSACGLVLLTAGVRFLRGELDFSEEAWRELYRNCLSARIEVTGLYVKKHARKLATEHGMRVEDAWTTDANDFYELLCRNPGPAVVVHPQRASLRARPSPLPQETTFPQPSPPRPPHTTPHRAGALVR